MLHGGIPANSCDISKDEIGVMYGKDKNPQGWTFHQEMISHEHGQGLHVCYPIDCHAGGILAVSLQISKGQGYTHRAGQMQL